MSDLLPDNPLSGGRVESRELDQEMRSSFLDYAMSVIVSRALPDVRDGLKPVPRPLLHGMHEDGLQPGRPYKKSAATVGTVMSRYHPHGDTAIYDTLVRMAQPFSLRYPLVDGQGNFGSIACDPPAPAAGAPGARARGTRPPRCVTPKRGFRASRRNCCATSTPTRSTSSRTT